MSRFPGGYLIRMFFCLLNRTPEADAKFLLDEFTLISLSLEQDSKTLAPMLVTDAGIEIDVNDSHPLKAEDPIDRTPSGTLMEDNFLHEEKEFEPMEVSVEGMVTDSRFSPSQKAKFPMEVAPLFITTLVMDDLNEYHGTSLEEE